MEEVMVHEEKRGTEGFAKRLKKKLSGVGDYRAKRFLAALRTQ